MKRKRHEVRDEIVMFIGLVAVILAAIGIIAVVVYGLIGNFTPEGIHLLATILVFVALIGLPGAYALGVREGKAHRAGMERGIDVKLAARERAARAQAPDPSVRPPMLPARSSAEEWESLRPDVYVSTNGGEGEIEM